MKSLFAFSAGLLFGVGLIFGGMTEPTVVLGFLDVAGDWNPRLVFVMAAAVAVTAIGYLTIRSAQRPLFDTEFHLPTRRDIDRRLLLGATLFGIGWGMAGYCPGPAVASLASAAPGVLVFVACMALGWWLAARLGR